MQQCGGVDKFNNGGGGDMLLATVIIGHGAEQNQQRPQALTAGFDNVVANVFDQVDIGVQTADD